MSTIRLEEIDPDTFDPGPCDEDSYAPMRVCENASTKRCRVCRRTLTRECAQRGACWICDKTEGKPISFLPRDRIVIGYLKRGINTVGDIVSDSGLSSRDVLVVGNKFRRAWIITADGKGLSARWTLTAYGKTRA